MRLLVLLLSAGVLLGGCRKEQDAAATKAPLPEAPPQTKGAPLAKKPRERSAAENDKEGDKTRKVGDEADKTKREDPTVLRAGARRLEAYRPGVYEVSFTPDTKLRLAKVDRACKGRRLAAQVGPFTQRIDANRADVAHGDRAVTRALAAQLHALGWLVQLWTDGSPAPGTPRPPANPIRFGLRGTIAFFVMDEKAGAKRGVIEGEVQLRDAKDAVIYTAKPTASSRVTRKQEHRVAQRTRQAESGAIHGFINTLLSDAGLTDALVRAIHASK